MDRDDNDEVPALGFDSLLLQLVDRAGELIGARDRLKSLVRANHDLVTALDLPTVRRRVCSVAAELVDARYAWLVVWDDDGELEDFVHHAVDEGVTGSLGGAVDRQRLLSDVMATGHPHGLVAACAPHCSCGTPELHEPEGGLLVVPIRPRQQLLGTLYLTAKRTGTFTADDEELVHALAVTAGIAMTNARLFDDLAYREQWSSVLAQASRDLSVQEGEEVTALLTGARDLAGAAVAAVTAPGDDPATLVTTHAVGLAAEASIGLVLPVRGTLAGKAVTSGVAAAADGVDQLSPHGYRGMGELGHALAVPFVIEDRGVAALVLARERGEGGFLRRDIEMAEAFAAQLGVVLAQAEVRATRERLGLVEDRQRIARDLHDHVIQRLFAAGLGLDAVVLQIGPGPVADRIALMNEEVNAAISQIRQSIFSLGATSRPTSLRGRVAEVVGTTVGFAVPPATTFAGPVEHVTQESLAQDVAAVVRESLANAVRHGRAGTAHVHVAVREGWLVVEVADDGIGAVDLTPRAERSGLSNMAERARRRGGSMTAEVVPRDDGAGGAAPVEGGAPGDPRAAAGGVVVRWSVPL